MKENFLKFIKTPIGAITTGGIFLMVCAIVSLVVLHKTPFLNKASYPTPTGDQTTQVTVSTSPKSTTKTITAMPTIDCPGCTVQTFSSSDLGVSFTYVTSSNQPYSAKEVGNKIYVYNSRGSYTYGQYVEVLTKSPEDNISIAINKEVLHGYNSSECKIGIVDMSKYNYPTNYIVAALHYADDPLLNSIRGGIPSGGNTKETNICPVNYIAASGVEYFLMDTNHPDKLLFFSIGQSGLLGNLTPSNNPPSWQDTIKFL